MTEPRIAWLLAQVDADERIALAAIADDGGQDRGFEDATENLTSGRFHVPRFAPAAAKMITTYAVPRRVLAEVDAKRRILDEYERYASERRRAMGGWDTSREISPVLSALALPYADRDGYDEHWGQA
jgi:hypothetical protein